MDAKDSTVAALAPTTAGDIMTSPVITVSPDAPTQDVAQTLTRNRISATPVVSGEGTLLGVVSEYDLLAKAGQTARDVMTTAVISVSTGTAVDDIRHLLIGRRIHRVPVMADGRLVGIVSLHDVLAMMATEWVCRVCGEPVRGEHPPSRCPRCHAAGEQFELQEQPPGA
ncbi:MAG TPA: CBS domain-containing protein [Mycobacterium sp.]|nr:CBS domain-containing protein [Mycobacterium sp.]